MKKIIGIEKKNYDYQGHQGYNYRVHLSEEITHDGYGCSVSYVKVKPIVIDKVTHRVGVDVSDLVGLSVDEIYYDNYKNVVDIIIHE